MYRHTIALRRAHRLLCCHALLSLAVSILLLSPSAPAFAVEPSSVLYVASFTANKVSAYTIEANGQLSLLGSANAGTGPFSITVHPSGQFAYVTNIHSLDITVYEIDETGMLVPHGTTYVGWEPMRAMAIHPSGRSAYVPWYFALNGWPVNPPPASYLRRYWIDDNGVLSFAADLDVGAIPRSVATDPSGQFLYAATQGSTDYAVSMYRTDVTNGTVTQILGARPGGSYPDSIVVTPSGQFVYMTNTDSNDVSMYAIGASGVLMPLGSVPAGRYPLQVAVDPSSRFAYVVNHDSNDVSTYTIGADGKLTSQGTAVAGVHPYSLAVEPTGRFAYVANFGSNNVLLYTIEPTTGRLTLQGPVATGSAPAAVTAFAPRALRLSVNGTSFRPGATMTLTATTRPGPIAQAVDLYVALQLPDQSLWFLQADGGLTTEVRPLVANWVVAPFRGELWRYTFNGTERAGLYTWLAAFTETGTMDILGIIAQAQFTFSP
jgi:6-phosphogluconolactonase (cycloisomerase 2 family)